MLLFANGFFFLLKQAVKVLSDEKQCPKQLGGVRIELTFTCTNWDTLISRVAKFCDNSKKNYSPVDLFLQVAATISNRTEERVNAEFRMKEVSHKEYLDILNRVVHAAQKAHLFSGGGSPDGEAGIIMLQGLADFYNAMGYSGHAIVKRY